MSPPGLEIDHLATWCKQNHFELNALQTVQMVVDFSKKKSPPSPCVTPQSTPWLALAGHHHPPRTSRTSASRTWKAQQRMNFLQQLEKFNLPETMMMHFYTAIIESILISTITQMVHWCHCSTPFTGPRRWSAASWDPEACR